MPHAPLLLTLFSSCELIKTLSHPLLRSRHQETGKEEATPNSVEKINS